MVLELRYEDGTIERGVHCLAIEQHGSVLDVYFTYRQYLDQLPVTFDTVKSFTVWPEENDSSFIEKKIQEELDKLTTYHMTSNGATAMVTLSAVKRILNLVFRGNRDNYPEGGKYGNKSETE